MRNRPSPVLKLSAWKLPAPEFSALELGWLTVAVLTPLWVNPWGLHLFDYAKAALVHTLVWAMAGLWLANRILDAQAGRPPPSQRGEPTGRRPSSLLLGAVGLLALLLLLTTVTALDWRLSLFGSMDRAQGLLTQLSQLLLFLLVATQLHSLAQIRRLVRGLVAGGAVVVLISLAQAAGWNPLHLVTDARSNLYATLGRANFLGAYLAMLLPLLLHRTFFSRGWPRSLHGLVALAALLVIGLTQARGAWLAAAVGLGLFALLALWPRLRPRSRSGLLLAGSLALFLSLAALLWLGRGGGSIAARLTIWQAVLELIARRPWLGFGPDSLGQVFPQVFPPQLVYYQGRQVFVDRAHNLLLDWLVTGGAPLALGWLLVYALYFRRIVQAIAGPLSRERRWLLAAGAAGVGANLAGNLVSFDVVTTATTAWLLMGLTVGLTWESTASPAARSIGLAEEGGQRPATLSSLAPGGRLLAAAGVGLATVLLITRLVLRPLLADGLLLRAQDQAATGDWPAALGSGERAVALWPFTPETSLALARLYRQRAATGADLDRAQEAYQAALALRPTDFVAWMELGEVHALQARAGERGHAALFQDAFRRAAALAPNHARLYVRWGEIQLALATSRAEREAAAEILQHGSDLDATDGYAYLRLGDARRALGQLEAAEAAYRQAAHWSPELIASHPATTDVAIEGQ